MLLLQGGFTRAIDVIAPCLHDPVMELYVLVGNNARGQTFWSLSSGPSGLVIVLSFCR